MENLEVYMKKGSLAVLVLIAAASMASANLLVNGDFANGTSGGGQFGAATINNWTTYGSSGWYQSDIGGNYSVKMWWDDSGIYQDWACTAGEQFNLTVDALQRSTPDPLVSWTGYLQVEFYDSTGTNKLASQQLAYFPPTEPHDTWVTLSGSYTAPVSAVSGRIVLGVENWATNASGSAYFDNATVNQVVPEPSLAGLVLFGAIGLVLLRRRG